MLILVNGLTKTNQAAVMLMLVVMTQRQAMMVPPHSTPQKRIPKMPQL
jgi:hypothetical protein